MTKQDESSIADYESPKAQGRERADAVLDDHAAGFRSATTQVRLRPNLHLMASLQALIAEAEQLEDDDPRLDDIEAEFEDVKAEFEAEKVLTLRAVSSELLRAIERDAKADGLDPRALADRLAALSKPKRPNVEAIEDLKDEAAEVGLRLQCRNVAAMVVDDDEVDEEWLYRLARSSESEWVRLMGSVEKVLNDPERVAPDFSRARSATRRAG